MNPILKKFINQYIFPYGLKWDDIYNSETDSFEIEEVNEDYQEFKQNA